MDSKHGPGSLKLGEPHDRFQGATNLKGAWWSKPPQPGGTARAERVREVATPGRSWRCAGWRVPSGADQTAALRSSGVGGSEHQVLMPMEGRTLTTPREESYSPTSDQRTAARPEAGRTAGRTGRRREDRVFVVEAKVMRAGPLVDPTPRRARTGSPSQARRIITRRNCKAKEGAWKRPTIRNPSMC